jgi:hypothetical protein
MFNSLADILHATIAHLTFQAPTTPRREIADDTQQNGPALQASPSNWSKWLLWSRIVRLAIRP